MVNSGDTIVVEMATHHAGDDYDKMVCPSTRFNIFPLANMLAWSTIAVALAAFNGIGQFRPDDKGSELLGSLMTRFAFQQCSM